MAVTKGLSVALAIVFSMSVHAGSARMELVVGGSLVAEAEYWPGAVDKPAILIVHGFLQTLEFPTVRRLAESLADEGYSVLTPSLTLGINRRRQSLACGAIHTHSMAQDIAELQAWTRWLSERAGKPPVLIGHSTGGLQLAAMLESLPGLPAEKLVMVSLVYLGVDEVESHIQLARRHVRTDKAAGEPQLHRYAISYCRDYVTTPARVLSYFEWDAGRLKQALRRIPIPTTVIVGDRDGQIDTGWLSGLQEEGVQVRRIRGADHFFDFEYEFDLLDDVVIAISGVNHG